MSLPLLLGCCLALALVLTSALWALSVRLADSSIVDIFWGSGFVAIAWLAYLLGDGARDRRLLLAVLTSIWGLRLTVHLARRNLGHGEDSRYAAMRRRHGERWARRSLWSVFWLQALLMWIVALPLQVAATDPAPRGLTMLDAAGAALWLAGLLFEAIGDAQLARFKAGPASAGRVMDRGLWRYTRHPNYFGDCCVWWGLYLIALAGGRAWWTLIGPLVMTVLLVRVSGAGLLERTIGERRPGYADYIRRTSGFVPLPPRRHS